MAVLATFRIRRDTAANWTSVNPVLTLGEPGLETDTRKVKYGNGSTAWNSLAYASEPFTAAITALAQLTPAADRLPYYTSTSAAALATLTSYARTLLDDADAATARATLGLGTAATQASTAFVPSTGVKTISGRTTQLSAEASQYSLSVLNTDANGWGHYIQAGTAAADRTFRVANGSGTVRFDIFSDGRIAAYNLPVYADNAAAVAGGLPASHLYRTATGEVRFRI